LIKGIGEGDASRGERPLIQLDDHTLTVKTPYLSADKANTGLQRTLLNDKDHWRIEIIQKYQINEENFKVQVLVDGVPEDDSSDILSNEMKYEMNHLGVTKFILFPGYKIDPNYATFQVKNFMFMTAPSRVNLNSCLYRPYYAVFNGRTLNNKMTKKGKLQDTTLSDCKNACDMNKKCDGFLLKNKPTTFGMTYDCYFRKITRKNIWSDDSTNDIYVKEHVNIKLADQYQSELESCDQCSTGNHCKSCKKGWCCAPGNKKDNGDCPGGVVNYLNYKISNSLTQTYNRLCATNCKGKKCKDSGSFFLKKDYFQKAEVELSQVGLDQCVNGKSLNKKVNKKCKRIRNNLVKSRCLRYESKILFGQVADVLTKLADRHYNELLFKKSKQCKQLIEKNLSIRSTAQEAMGIYLKCAKKIVGKKCYKKFNQFSTSTDQFNKMLDRIRKTFKLSL